MDKQGCPTLLSDGLKHPHTIFRIICVHIVQHLGSLHLYIADWCQQAVHAARHMMEMLHCAVIQIKAKSKG